jgi:four helix bundle protein
MQLVVSVHKITTEFPQSELYGLTNQIRRAAISIPSNIAEGCGRRSDKELAQFLNISIGSVSELETQIEISHILAYINVEQSKSIVDEITIIRKMLLNLVKSIRLS